MKHQLLVSLLALSCLCCAAPGLAPPLPASAAVRTAEDDCFGYRLYDDHAEIISYGNAGAPPQSYAEVPGTIQGLPVTAIGDNVFRDQISLTAVTLPETVTTLGHRVFSGCENLAELHLPRSLTEVPDDVFDYGCLWYDEHPEGALYVGGILWEYRGQCPEGCELRIREGTAVIRKAACYGQKGLASVTFPGTVEEVAPDAFLGTAWLEEQPEGMLYINRIAYKYISRLDYDRMVALYGDDYTLDDRYDMPRSTTLRLREGTETIADQAFGKLRLLPDVQGFHNLTAIEIPDSVRRIGDQAFAGCTGLRTVRFGAESELTEIGREAFKDCTALEGFQLPAGVTRIDCGTFSGCTALRQVRLPQGLREIGLSAFADCTGLESISLPGSVAVIGADADPLAPYAGVGAFEGCTALRSVRLPKALSELGSCTFRSCTCLEGLTIPAGLTELPDGLLSGCTSLTEVTLPEGITHIPDRFFEGCTALTAAALPQSVRSIGSRAFSGCTALETITFPDTLETIGQAACSGCEALQEAALPDTVYSIGEGAFRDCRSLTAVTLPLSLTTLEPDTFHGCTSLGEVSCPTETDPFDETMVFGLSVIGGGAFAGCTALSEIGLPDSLVQLDAGAFRDCTGLREIELPVHFRYLTGGSAFPGCTGLRAVRVAAGNRYFCSEDGVLFDSSRTALLQYPAARGGSYTVPESTLSICQEAFYSCGLETLTIPDTVTEIEGGAFADSKYLRHVTLPAGLLTLYTGTFEGCVSLQGIELPENLRRISSAAFMGSGLREIVIPASVGHIDGGFEACTALQSVTIENPDCVIRDYSFNNEFAGFRSNRFDGVLYGAENSSTREYAEKWELRFGVTGTGKPVAVRGDINGDGRLDVLDVVLLQKWVHDQPGALLPEEAAADLTGDGTIDQFDLSLLKHWLLQK